MSSNSTQYLCFKGFQEKNILFSNIIVHITYHYGIQHVSVLISLRSSLGVVQAGKLVKYQLYIYLYCSSILYNNILSLAQMLSVRNHFDFFNQLIYIYYISSFFLKYKYFNLYIQQESIPSAYLLYLPT